MLLGMLICATYIAFSGEPVILEPGMHMTVVYNILITPLLSVYILLQRLKC